MLSIGDPLPWFGCRTHQSDRYRVETLAGQIVALVAFGTTQAPPVRAALAELVAARGRLEGLVTVAGLAISAEDAGARAFSEAMVAPVFLDTELVHAKQLGLLVEGTNGAMGLRPLVYLLDRTLRVAEILPIRPEHPLLPRLLEAAAALREREAAFSPPAPILVLPGVLEPELCRTLIDRYLAHGGKQSGFMRTDANGRTVEAFDPKHKLRRDHLIEDEALKTAIRTRLHRRIVPHIQRAYQFEATRIERYLVACYAADEGGHFRAHRDNTTKGTAHRRFAVSINLDTSQHEGGDLRFPEFGRTTYRPPSGGAVVFSCSLLHEATPVTAGRRFCVLPFLYDDAAAKIRDTNRGFIGAEAAA